MIFRVRASLILSVFSFPSAMKITMNSPSSALWVFIIIATSRIQSARPLPDTDPAKPGSTDSVTPKREHPASSHTLATDEDEPYSPPDVFEDAGTSFKGSAFSPSPRIPEDLLLSTDTLDLSPPTPDDDPGTPAEGRYICV